MGAGGPPPVALFDPEQFHADLGQYPALQSFYAGDAQAAICRLWGAGQADPAEAQPVRSDLPTLILTDGNYDPATPPIYARLAAEPLSRHFLYEFPALSHGVSFNECPKALLAAFLDNPTSPPDAACMAAEKGLPFIVDVYINHGATNIFTAAQFSNVRYTVALSVLGLLFLLALTCSSCPGWQRRSPSHCSSWAAWLGRTRGGGGPSVSSILWARSRRWRLRAR